MADEVKTEEIKTEEVIESPAKDKFISGSSNAMKQHKEAKETVSEPPVNKEEYDYTVLKDLNDDDYKKYESLKEKDEGSYYEILSHRNDMKKNQRLVAEREKTIKELQSKITTPEDIEKMKEFVSGLRTDAIGTYKRFQKDFNLPEPEFLEKQMISGGSVEDRLSQWQENELMPSIEKKFKLDGGTFVYDAAEAYRAGTPSYEYRVQTEKRERALSSEYENTVQRQQTILTKVKEQNDADLKYLRETFFPNVNYGENEEASTKADEAFAASLAELDEIQRSNQEGEFDPTRNPFSLKVIWTGLNFDKLLNTALEKERNSIHKQYNEKGLYLKNGEDMPTDVTKPKGTASAAPPAKKKYGMLHKRLENTINMR